MQAGTWAAASAYSNSRLPLESLPHLPLSSAVSVRVSLVKACGPSEGIHQLEVTELEVILHVIPEIHCGEERDQDVRAPLLRQSHHHPTPCWAVTRPAPRVLLTSNAAMGLPNMVEPQSWQVQHFAGPHCAVKCPCLAIARVPGQVWSQGVQRNPGYLETQQLSGSRPRGPQDL